MGLAWRTIMADREVVSCLEAGRRLCCSRRKVYKLCTEGELEGYNVGRNKIIYADSIEAFKDRHRFGSEILPAGIQPGVRLKVLPPVKKAVAGLRHLRL